jgi:hypothetical protein
MNTIRQVEEIWLDQGKDGETNTHKDGTSLNGLCFGVEYD